MLLSKVKQLTYEVKDSLLNRIVVFFQTLEDNRLLPKDINVLLDRRSAILEPFDLSVSFRLIKITLVHVNLILDVLRRWILKALIVQIISHDRHSDVLDLAISNSS